MSLNTTYLPFVLVLKLVLARGRWHLSQHTPQRHVNPLLVEQPSDRLAQAGWVWLIGYIIKLHLITHYQLALLCLAY